MCKCRRLSPTLCFELVNIKQFHAFSQFSNEVGYVLVLLISKLLKTVVLL